MAVGETSEEANGKLTLIKEFIGERHLKELNYLFEKVEMNEDKQASDCDDDGSSSGPH